MSNTIRKQRVNFTQISNDLLNDSSISLTAKGIYSFMFSKPDNWNFTIKSMSKQLKEGQRAIGNALKELKDNGWVIYTKYTNGTGRYDILIEPLLDPKLQNEDMAQQSQSCKKATSSNVNVTKRSAISNKDNSINKDTTTTTIYSEEAFVIFDSFGLNKSEFRDEFTRFKILNDYDSSKITKKYWMLFCQQIKKFNKNIKG